MRSTTKESPTETGLGETLARRQRRAKEFLGEIRARTDAAKEGLLSQLERILETIEEEKSECRKTREELVAKAEELHRQTEIVGKFRDDFAQWQEQREAACQKSVEQQTALSERIEKQQAILDEKLAGLKKLQDELDKREEELRRTERETSLAKQDFDAQQQYLEEKQNRLNERLAEVEMGREELAVLRKRTAAQRHKLAAAVKARRAAGGSVMAAEAVPSEPAETPGIDNEAFAELETRRRELEDELRGAKEELSRQSDELDELVQEKIGLIQRLEDAEQRAAQSPEGEGAGASGTGELDAEIERLSERNQELEAEIASMKEQLAETGAARGALAAAAAVAEGGAMDWESQKARLLASLENEGDNVPPEREQERIEIGHVIEQTDAIITEKTREIEELNALLQERSENVGAVAVGAAAVGEILDQDEVIAQERARLDELKQEWEAKLRQAEVDISLERASIAREKAILAEAIEKYPELAEGHVTEGKGADSSRKKWMSALGLSDEDDEQAD